MCPHLLSPVTFGHWDQRETLSLWASSNRILIGHCYFCATMSWEQGITWRCYIDPIFSCCDYSRQERPSPVRCCTQQGTHWLFHATPKIVPLLIYQGKSLADVCKVDTVAEGSRGQLDPELELSSILHIFIVDECLWGTTVTWSFSSSTTKTTKQQQQQTTTTQNNSIIIGKQQQ